MSLPLCVRPEFVGSVDEEANKSIPADSESLSAMYFLGDVPSLDRTSRPRRGVVHKDDRVVAVLKRLPLPAVGEVLDKYAHESKGREGVNVVFSAAADV